MESGQAALVRYQAYSRLQAAAVAFGESLPIPEIVAIGGQSDGKSSLLEAFLGFRFNVTNVEMGTRRPLIVQMVHDLTAQQPRCRLQDEESDEYGPPIQPETAVAEAIRGRTEKHLRRTGGTVSSKPIVMRAEFAFCPNLTIIDTPGFILKARQGEEDSTPDQIIAMVKAQAAPPHRLILFLQQSSVEWASSLWMHVVQEVDPNFQRTVVVASKFDNRLKEFTERWEVDRYLSASGYLHPNAEPYFVALPKERSIGSSEDWRHQIQEVDTAIFKHLRENINDGFDEDKYGHRIGFGNLKYFLEDELARRYRDAAPATLALLQERCEAVAAELAAAESQLNAANDVAAMRQAAMKHVYAVAMQIKVLLDGGVATYGAGSNTAAVGMTTEEERTACCAVQQWPSVTAAVNPATAGLRLFGGAAFERCLHEFQEAVHALEFPSVPHDRVANILLAFKAKGQTGGQSRAAEDIARSEAKALLWPLLDTICKRLGFVLRQAFDIAANQTQHRDNLPSDMLRPYVAFHAALRSSYQAFVSSLEEQCRALIRHHLDAATSGFILSLTDGMEEEATLDSMAECREENVQKYSSGIQPVKDITNECHRLRESQMTVPETPSPDLLAAGKTEAKTRRQEVSAAGGAPPPAYAKCSQLQRLEITCRYLDDKSPAKGRVTKLQKTLRGIAAPASSEYSTVCITAERIFKTIKHSVAGQAVPATLKSAFLEPISTGLASELGVDLFARADADFMAMFAASSAIALLVAKREALGRRVEGLTKCKDEFQELARCL